MITYKQLAEFVTNNMTEAERNKPVMFYDYIYLKLFPQYFTSHPDIFFASEIEKLDELNSELAEDHPNQYVIHSYLSKEEAIQVALLEHERKLLEDLSYQQRIHHEYVVTELKKGRYYWDIIHDNDCPPMA